MKTLSQDQRKYAAWGGVWKFVELCIIGWAGHNVGAVLDINLFLQSFALYT